MRKENERLVDALGPESIAVEKVASSAFHMSRLEWALRKSGVEHRTVAGIVTNGCGTSTAREAHVGAFGPTVLSDGCAAVSPAVHDGAIAALRPVAAIASTAEAPASL